MASSNSMQDIEPGESISQIGFGLYEAESSTSAAGTGLGNLTSSDMAFRSQFGAQKTLADKFLIIENDPVTLMRSAHILEVRSLKECD